MRLSRLAYAVATAACYVAIVSWLTWPLAGRLATHLPHPKFTCDFDLPQMIWALSWQTHALLTAPSSLLDANAYHPSPHSLLYADAGIGALPYFVPTYLATGNPVLSSNLMFLGGVALTASALQILVTQWTGLASAGFVAAATFLVTPWVLWTWMPAAPNYAVCHLVPAIIFLAALPEISSGRAVLLASLVLLQGAANPYYAAATLVPLTLIACARLASPTLRPSGRRLMGVVIAASVGFLVLYAPYAWLRVHEPGVDRQTPWLHDRLRPRRVPMVFPLDLINDPDKPVSVPIGMLALIAVGYLARMIPRRGRTADEAVAWRHGLLWAACGIVLSLSSHVTVAGWTFDVPLQTVLDRLPLVNALRDPLRIGVGALFGLSILAGAAFAEWTRWIERVMNVRRPAVLRAAAALLLVAVAAGPRFRAAKPAPYPVAAAAVGERAFTRTLPDPKVPVLFLPVNGPNRLSVHAAAMFDSIGRWEPLLNGYGGFYPAAFPARMRLAARLPDARALVKLRRSTDVGLVVVWADMMAPDAVRRWDDLARRGGGEGLRFVARAGRDLLFSVDGGASGR